MSQTILTNGLGYEGKVTLTLKSNNLVLESKTYKNSGTTELFDFLANCLAGKFNVARLPSKILLLFNGSDNAIKATATSCIQRSAWVSRAQAPTVDSSPANQSTKVTYNFEVPKNAIAGEFNQIALYGANSTEIDKFSAYYYLANSSGDFLTEDPAEWSPSTVLLIDWELTISNNNTVELTNYKGV